MAPPPRGLDVDAWRAEIPLTSRVAYLNNAATSPTPLFVNEAVAAHYRERSERADGVFDEWVARVEDARRSVARLVGMTPGGVAFTKNTGDGIGIVATSLDWAKGDNVVVTGREFPTNWLPWRRLSRFGVELRTVTSDEEVLPAAAWEQTIDDRTRLVAFSQVEYATGVRNDVPAIARIAHRAGATVLVDAIQGLGAVPLEAGADIVVAGGHKWLMSPLGVGFLALKPELARQLEPAVPGWFSLADTNDYTLAAPHYAQTARRFEPGNLNFSGIDGMRAALDALPSAAETETRIGKLTGILVEGLRSADLDVVTPADPKRRAGIVTFRHPDPETVVAGAQRQGVALSARGSGVRLSPHFWNTEQEMERALAAVGAAG